MARKPILRHYAYYAVAGEHSSAGIRSIKSVKPKEADQMHSYVRPEHIHPDAEGPVDIVMFCRFERKEDAEQVAGYIRSEVGLEEARDLVDAQDERIDEVEEKLEQLEEEIKDVPKLTVEELKKEAMVWTYDRKFSEWFDNMLVDFERKQSKFET